MKFDHGAFARASAMASAIAAAMMLSVSERGTALASIGPYVSHGKGGKRPHTVGNGAARVKRAALKIRNRAKHRRACSRKGR